MSNATETSELESKSLPTHVEKCALRYEQMQNKLNSIDEQFTKIDQRFDRIDDKISAIETDMKKGNKDIIVALIGATATIIAAFVGIIVMMV